MRDLNSLYSEFLVTQTLRERRQQAHQRELAATAAAMHPALWQRLASRAWAMLPARPGTASRPAAMGAPKRVTAA